MNESSCNIFSLPPSSKERERERVKSFYQMGNLHGSCKGKGRKKKSIFCGRNVVAGCSMNLEEII